MPYPGAPNREFLLVNVDTEHASPRQSLEADLVALRTEVAQLRARLDDQERILQIRDAAFGPPTASSAPQVASAPLPIAYEIAADQLLPTQDGFYQLEWGPEGAFRWTGPGADVHFETWIDRSAPLHATVAIFHFGTPDNAKDMTVEVDGTHYPLHREGSEKVLRSDPIAPRPGDGATRFTLHVPHIHSPASSGFNNDRRILGVAFQRLRIARG